MRKHTLPDDARIVLDSIGPNGVRLTTMEVRLWKPLVGEFNTHRVFSRNSASSRAIPVEVMEQMITDFPHVPVFHHNQKGMQPAGPLDERPQRLAGEVWLGARDGMMHVAQLLRNPSGYNIANQWVNRLLEPWMYTTILVTATEWDNFFYLRDCDMAQAEIRDAAKAMKRVMAESVPRELRAGDWHLPYAEITMTGRTVEERKLISAGRCATVSYDNLGAGVDSVKDIERAERLLGAGHWSVFEHQAMALESWVIDKDIEHMTCKVSDFMNGVDQFGNWERLPSTDKMWSGNFRGWVQNRKLMEQEELVETKVSA